MLKFTIFLCFCIISLKGQNSDYRHLRQIEHELGREDDKGVLSKIEKPRFFKELASSPEFVGEFRLR